MLFLPLLLVALSSLLADSDPKKGLPGEVQGWVGVHGPTSWAPALLFQGHSCSSCSPHGFLQQLEQLQHGGFLVNQPLLRCGVCTHLPFT